MEILDRIEEIWKDNPKIPFMQSKEILKLGYRIAIEDLDKKPVNKDNNKKEETSDFIGTSKELIKFSENKIKTINKKSNKEEKQKLSIEKGKIIKDTQMEILSDILFYMKNPNHDYLSLLDYIISKISNIQTDGTGNLMHKL